MGKAAEELRGTTDLQNQSSQNQLATAGKGGESKLKNGLHKGANRAKKLTSSRMAVVVVAISIKTFLHQCRLPWRSRDDARFH